MPSLTSEPGSIRRRSAKARQVDFKSEPITAKKNPWYLNAYLHIGLNVVLQSVAQILFKIGSDNTPGGSLLGVASLKSLVVWIGIACMVGSLLAWLHALRSVPLIIASNLAAATQVVIPLGCWLFLGEQISLVRCAGILVVTVGIMIIARPLAKLEERL